MYIVYVSNKQYDNDFYNILEFGFEDYETATDFINVVINHSEGYTVEINKIKGE